MFQRTLYFLESLLMFFEHSYCLELKKRDSDRIFATCEDLLKMSK